MTWIVEHAANGAVRCLQRAPSSGPDWTPLAAYARCIVSDIPPSIESVEWFASRHGCLECGAGWAAIGPMGADLGKLECARCGSSRSAIAEDAWCYGCGASYTTVREKGCRHDGMQCPKCGQMKAMVA